MRLLALAALLLLMLPAVATAQDPSPTPTAGIEDQAPGLDDEATDDPVDEDAPVDGDDAYTAPCSTQQGTDGDYTYCADSQPGGGARPKRKNAPAAAPVAAETLAAGTLPYTGASPGLIALLGLALMMMGVGVRMMAASSSAVRSRSSVTWR